MSLGLPIIRGGNNSPKMNKALQKSNEDPEGLSELSLSLTRWENDENVRRPIHGRSLMLEVLQLFLHTYSPSMIFQDCQDNFLNSLRKTFVNSF